LFGIWIISASAVLEPLFNIDEKCLSVFWDNIFEQAGASYSRMAIIYPVSSAYFLEVESSRADVIYYLCGRHPKKHSQHPYQRDEGLSDYLNLPLLNAP